MEEPVCDPPAVSLQCISKIARRDVTVLLSGEGGDEAFGGYHTYRNFILLEEFKRMAGPLSSVGAGILAGAGRFPSLHKVAQFAPYMNLPLPEYYYSRAASPFSYFNRNKPDLYTPEFAAAVSRDESNAVIRDLFRRMEGQPCLNQMQYIDTKTSLPDDLLIKADKMTMVNSLELRVPFLDHLVLEFAASLPPAFRVKGRLTKRILKDAFRNRIPQAILQRKKAGFPVPIEQWIRSDFKNQVREILLSPIALSRGFFRKEAIEKLLTSSEAGGRLDKEVFSLLTLELLQREFVGN
jgi:asparagine synthase (glutamine-hydrolysing)